jgi:thiol-disulfide isomerase/thioredoxin
MFPIFHRISLIVALAFTTSMVFADSTTADEAWKKVEAAIKSLENPANPPKSREEAVAHLKSGLTAFDSSLKDFSTSAPSDARRWQAKIFEAKTANARGFAGLPPSSDMSAILDEILTSSDAPQAIKGEASGMKVLVSVKKMSEEEWQKKAEQHLQTYPEAPMNPQIEGQMAKIAVMAKLKTQPLDLKFTAMDGTKVDLAKMRGKVVLIDFWATWCGPCVQEVPNLVKAYENLHSKGFEIVGVSLDQDKAKLEGFTKEKGMTWPQYFDGKGWQNEISSRFSIQSIPAMWLIDKKGMLVSTSARPNLAEQVEKLLAE